MVDVLRHRSSWKTLFQFSTTTGTRPVEDDESDAFRHFVWAGLLKSRLGESKAREVLQAHEQSSRRAGGSAARSSEMDSANNESGIRTADELERAGALTLDALEKAGLDALKRGDLKVLSPKGGGSPYPF